ncbi:uncharacterized protein LOC120165209 [Hibiscus syriacus]|nr:uncharacterized protein LOC120165209 [Hibiscus syriacus]
MCRTVSWEPPPKNWYKVNTGGAYDVSSNHSGCGGVIRDAGADGLVDLHEEINNCEVCSTLQQARNSDMASPLLPIIVELLERDWTVQITHVVREKNVAADYMARIGRSMAPGLRTYNTPPAEVLDVIQVEADH